MVKLSILLIPTVLATSLVKRPFGVKMCEQFCYIGDCTHNFIYADLSCQVTFIKDSLRSGGYKTQSTSRPVSARKSRPEKKLPSRKTYRKPAMIASLLIAFQHEVFEVSLTDLNTKAKRVRDKGFFEIEHDITAVVFSNSFKQYIVGTKKDTLLMVKGNQDPYHDRPKQKLLLKQVKVNCMAIYEDKNSVLIGTNGGINLFSLPDNKRKRVIRSGLVKAISFDTTNLKIYFVTKSEILVSYEKYDDIYEKKTIKKINQVTSIAHHAGSLIFVQRGTLKFMATGKNLRDIPNFVCYRDLIIYCNKDLIKTIDMVNEKRRTYTFMYTVNPVLNIKEEF